MANKPARIKKPAAIPTMALGNTATAEIRQAIKARGPRASVAEVVAQFKAKGVNVTRTQVATIKQALFDDQAISGRNTRPTSAIHARHSVAKKKSAGAGTKRVDRPSKKAPTKGRTATASAGSKKKATKRPLKNALRMPHA